ncbi:MAG: helix-turn-helix domain containing protein [Prevotellaceae bacterium]|jgi:hypothetical protein|nr:helix-turn-helix domain containing protein [Prevotellaceae bacterium]
MSVKERLLEYIKYKKISNSAFCRAINVSNAFISSMRKSIQPDKIEGIALKFPDISIEWLLTGKGEMLKKDQPLKEDGTAFTQQIFELLKNQLEEKDRQIAEKDKQIIALTETLQDEKNGFATPAVKQRRAVR